MARHYAELLATNATRVQTPARGRAAAAAAAASGGPGKVCTRRQGESAGHLRRRRLRRRRGDAARRELGRLLGGHGAAAVLDQMQKDFNCQIQYDAAWPWFPKFVAGGPTTRRSTSRTGTWTSSTRRRRRARRKTFFVPIEELNANVPNSEDLWPFAYTIRPRHYLPLQRLWLRLPHRHGRPGADQFSRSGMIASPTSAAPTSRPTSFSRHLLHHGQPRVRQGRVRHPRRSRGDEERHADEDQRLHRQHADAVGAGRSRTSASRPTSRSMRRSTRTSRLSWMYWEERIRF